jgi:hypothetical protein
MISLLQRAPEEGLIREIYWLCSTHDILKTNYNMVDYTQENIKHIPLWIGQYRTAVPNILMKTTSTNNDDSEHQHLKIPAESNTRPCPRYLMTIDRNNKCQQVRVSLDSDALYLY